MHKTRKSTRDRYQQVKQTQLPLRGAEKVLVSITMLYNWSYYHFFLVPRGTHFFAFLQSLPMGSYYLIAEPRSVYKKLNSGTFKQFVANHFAICRDDFKSLFGTAFELCPRTRKWFPFSSRLRKCTIIKYMEYFFGNAILFCFLQANPSSTWLEEVDAKPVSNSKL